MYANPVYELAKCTRKCIRRTINCRSSLEEVLRNYGKLGEIESSWAKLSPRLRVLSIYEVTRFLKAASEGDRVYGRV